MQATSYPGWFHWLRGFIIGLTVGALAMALGYDLTVVRLGGSALLLYAVFAVPWIVLGPFEVYFAVRRYRAIRRAMDGRTGAG